MKNRAENLCRRHEFSFGQQQKTDDVMFGLTDMRTDPLEPRNSCYKCSAERTIDAFTGKLTKTRLHLSEEHLWRTIAAKYLSPEKTQRHHTHTVRKQMTRLRNVVILLLVVLNVAYITLVLGYDMDQTSHIMWYFNGDTKVSPMYALSSTIQAVLLIVQIVSMLIYRRQVFAALWNRVVSISVFRWKFFCRQLSRSKISECDVV
ncbi:PREDICTED: uncharacterized protein LOC106818959 [Priapulus caudatus]|uniref:Uncharacterized protein LOC106818959 n=1 Tax=Priapulus caudatus TaxID=37621 RepID=A0ABM1F3U0_PRICU|nr:PREDICTED: uncharacterized protein LOC106818959 [Priapulus caudatus]XP_014679112.1 PREDICTED: uncharacterized protein LOC106818959 [Priapulus caudatus]